MSSNQNIATPWPFFYAVEEFLGIRFKFDIAANSENTKCQKYFTEKQDCLKQDWPLDGWCWLNPPFRKQTQFIPKVYEQMDRGCKIVTIWQLSGDANQLPTWKHSHVYVVTGRIWVKVRGVMLCKWDKQSRVGISGLIWDKEKLVREW